MRAIWIGKHGGPEVLEVRDTPDPEPGPGEVRVSVRAAGLNFAEVAARQGLYPDAPKPPCVVGYEAAGVVEALGEGVTSPKVNTRALLLSRFGAHADTVCVPADHLVSMPRNMSFDQGAALPVVYLTAYRLVSRVGAVQPGERVLVHMAAGGVGTAVIQLCRSIKGVEVFGTASESKHELLREMGCDHPIDYHQVDYAAEVLRLTDGEGVDVVLDPLGGKDWSKGYRLLRPGGRLVAYGFANMSTGGRRSVLNVLKQLACIPVYSPFALMGDNRAVAGVNLGKLWNAPGVLRADLDEVVKLFKRGKISPLIDSKFSFEEAADAHRRIEDRLNVGKVLLVP